MAAPHPGGDLRRALAGLGLAALALLAIAVVRALALESRQLAPAAPARDAQRVDADGASSRLAAAIRLRTVSDHDGGDRHAAAFEALHRQLERAYPLVHARLRRERVGGHGLLYTWTGRDPDAPALLLAAHQDVVPVEADTEPDWRRPPFAGERVDGVVWGRGALDDKGSLVAILEATESLLGQGFAPERSVLLAFGHDEEIGGHDGAEAIAARLASRGARVGSVLDEGGFVAEDAVDRVDRPVAVVGIAEKGAVSLKLSVRTEGGHSSTPPRHSGVGILAAAVRALEENPMPSRIDGTSRLFLETLAPELGFAARLALANLWLTGPLLESAFRGAPPLDAMIRTTTAVTMFHGGVKANVLPKKVEAVVNFRILPGDGVEEVVRHVRRTIDDERIRIEPTGASAPREPSPISPVDSEAFAALQRAIGAVHPDAIVVPYLVVGGTDARHYARLTPNVYRFLPFRVGRGAQRLIHGTDERLSVENLAAAVRFYRLLIRGG